MRVSFDSNAWETIFTEGDRVYASIRAALAERRIEGFICETGFRIEAVRKLDRATYFAQPYMDVRFDGIVNCDGQAYVQMSLGPDDLRHPGLPTPQRAKLQNALAAGIRFMRGQNWMGLPRPQAVHDPALFVQETPDLAGAREQRQIEVSALIDARGVGKAAFDEADGWNVSSTNPIDKKKLWRACAEWADGELVAAHVAYQNDVLCTNDRARAAGASIFDATNRAWLTADFGVTFMTADELAAKACS